MNVKKINICKNRADQKYTSKELTARFFWELSRPLFRFSPRTFFGWRNSLLRLFGARIGNNVHIYNTAVIYMPWNLEVGDWSSIGEYSHIYNLGNIQIGNQTTISHRAHLCAGTHDYTIPNLPLLKHPIHIGNQVWICADAFVGPGVSIGEGAVVGARSVVVKDVKSWSVVAGNPSILIKKRVLKEL